MAQNFKVFSLHISDYLARTAWALAVDVDGENSAVVASGFVDGTIDDRTSRLVLTATIDAMERHEHLLAGGVADLMIFNRTARGIMLDLGGQFGPIRVLSRSEMKYQAGWDREGWARCLDLLGCPEFSDIRAAGRVVEAATDGSFSPGAGGGASCGWVRDDGRFGFATVDTANVLVSELAGINALLTAADPGDILHIHVDSKSALRAIETGRDDRDRLNNYAESLLRDIETQRRRVTATFSWVKGHQGHALNDGADRLARLARQAQDSSDAARGKVARNIVADALTAHRGRTLAHL